MKKLLSACLLGIVLLVAGCGKQEANEQTKKTGDLLTNIKKEGELRIGTEGTYPPFTFHDKNGKLTGFDVEIATEVAKRLGVKPVFMETQWDAMFAGLDAKRFDMIANQVGIRPDRQKKYDFSIPYTTSSAVLVVRKDNNQISGFENIKGLKAAQSMTSNFADLARSYGAEIVGVEGFNQAIELLSSKRVDVTINDKLSVLDFLKQKPNAPIKIVAAHKDASQSGLMFRKGNDSLVKAVNKALQDMMKDGTYAKISEKWFGQDVSK
ncbi:amino acid ABC transporter substrate-binding protein [Anoxybacteroides tepidamans]|uniref:amino acid ABC transporter substrate-binding protein n=1 Tax=Anoxybacteroides tepidamans TaxID=265948 RepID=UPI00048301F5|nr:amino acid ABC transporter substrate-binding protein [Anoxybacillus tepidamans]